MELNVLRRKIYYGFSLIIIFLISCHYSFSTDLKDTFSKIVRADSITGIIYKVQVGAFTVPIESDQFNRELINDHYVLTFGNFSNYKKADNAKDSLIAAGHPQAWVPIYINGIRSDLKEVGIYLNSLEKNVNIEISKDLLSFDEYNNIPSNSLIKDLFLLRGGDPFYSYILYAIIFFSGITFSLISTMVLRRHLLKKSLDKRKYIELKIRRFFTDIVLEENLTNQSLDKQLSIFKDSIPIHKTWCKIILITNLIELKKNFKGEMASMFIDIYIRLDLNAYSQNLITNGIWYQKTVGIYHFEELGYSEGLPFITPYIEHSNETLKSVALIAYIALKETDPLAIFNNYTGYISKIDELKIIDTIKKKKIKVPPYINEWLQSNNTSLILLTIKLISYYNHLDAGVGILQMLEYNNEEIRRDAIMASRHLLLIKAEDILIDKFNSEPYINQIEIIKTLSVIGSEPSNEFLGNLLESTDTREIKIETMKALNEMNSWLYQSSFKHNTDLRLVKLHVEDPYIL